MGRPTGLEPAIPPVYEPLCWADGVPLTRLPGNRWPSQPTLLTFFGALLQRLMTSGGS